VSSPRVALARPAPSEAGAMPRGLVSVPVGKGCILLLSEEEYVRAIRRGKAWRRRQALRRRGAMG
jgi:hypothetical protein